MAKRFISTNLFDDNWFMELKPNTKLLWIYFITKCDHAGIINFNEKLCKFQTGLNDVQGCLNDLKTRIYKISESHYFIPKFIYFQYPDFPNSKVNQQKGAMVILRKYNLVVVNQDDIITSLKDVKSLSKTYVYDNVNDNDNGKGEYEGEIKQIIKYYRQFAHLKLTVEEFNKLSEIYSKSEIDNILDDIENYKKNTNYKSLYFTANKWLKSERNKTKPDTLRSVNIDDIKY